MTDLTSLQAIGTNTTRLQPKGEMYLLVFIVIFGLIGLAFCMGLGDFSSESSNEGLTQVEFIHEDHHRKT